MTDEELENLEVRPETLIEVLREKIDKQSETINHDKHHIISLQKRIKELEEKG